MYELDGDFGRVRHIRSPFGGRSAEVPFSLISGGWHRCNDKYRYQRDGSQGDHLLLFSISNGGTLKLADREAVSLPASSVAWLPPGRGHAYGTEAGGLWEFYWMHLEDTEYLRFQKMFDEESLLKISNMEPICREFEKMIRSRQMDTEEFQVESSRMVGNIYHCLLQESTRQKKGNDKRDELVHRIIQEMESHCSMEWSLPEISEQYFISVPQLIRRFKAETGMTPHAYLMTIRLQTAEMYLQYTSLSVEEISKKTGFAGTSNFILQFRKYRGMTPQQYRRSGS